MSISDSSKKRGRPTTGIGKPIGLRLYPELDAALDAWIAAQSDPKPSRPEAIRELMQRGLGAPDKGEATTAPPPAEKPPTLASLFRDYLAADPEARMSEMSIEEAGSLDEAVEAFFADESHDNPVPPARVMLRMFEDRDDPAARRICDLLRPIVQGMPEPKPKGRRRR